MPSNQLATALQAAGFHKPLVQDAPNGLWVRVDNTSYAWNLLDAAGAALGPVAAAYGKVAKSFVLEVSRRGIVLARLEGTSNCAYQFLTEGSLACSTGTINIGMVNVMQVLIIGESMDCGHRTQLNTNAVIKHFGDRRQTVSRARSVGNDL